jgi:hypothetical protein
MRRFRSWAGLLGVLFLAAPAAGNTDRYSGADEVAARIDRLLEESWKKAKITPARPADDAEWLRRVYLDLAGRIPSVAEARSFLGDRGPDKRKRLVETLLAGPRYPTAFAGIWRRLLLPEDGGNLQVRLLAGNFEQWLRSWLASDRGYDWLVHQLATSAPDPRGMRGISTNPTSVFYFAKENKPEEIAATFSSTFLGVNLQCAQCHNHPFASWKREQFWSFAAFFSDLQPRRPDRSATRPKPNTASRSASD